MTDPDAGGLPQALASAPRCPSCSHIGSGTLCRLRDLDVRPAEATTCASHSETTRKPDPVPVGPVLRIEDASLQLVAQAPTDQATRDHLFALLAGLHDDFGYDGSLRHRVILGQSRQLDEQRARIYLDALEERLQTGRIPNPLAQFGLAALIEQGAAPGKDGLRSARPFTFAGRTLVFTACLVFAGTFWLGMELLVDNGLAFPMILVLLATAGYVQMGLWVARKRGIPLREPEPPATS